MAQEWKVVQLAKIIVPRCTSGFFSCSLSCVSSAHFLYTRFSRLILAQGPELLLLAAAQKCFCFPLVSKDQPSMCTSEVSNTNDGTCDKQKCLLKMTAVIWRTVQITKWWQMNLVSVCKTGIHLIYTIQMWSSVGRAEISCASCLVAECAEEVSEQKYSLETVQLIDISKKKILNDIWRHVWYQSFQMRQNCQKQCLVVDAVLLEINLELDHSRKLQALSHHCNFSAIWKHPLLSCSIIRMLLCKSVNLWISNAKKHAPVWTGHKPKSTPESDSECTWFSVSPNFCASVCDFLLVCLLLSCFISCVSVDLSPYQLICFV